MNVPARFFSAMFVCSLSMSTVSGQEPIRPAVAVDAIGTVLDAFRSNQVVALGEGGHTNEQSHAFRVSLIRDPRFANAANDIVVEFGNSRYQDVIDRFVGGDDIPDAQLRQVWQNTTQPTTLWDAPIYEDFFRAVRAVNTGLSRERRLRVLLGDPPIDWDTIHGRDDMGRWISNRELSDRDRYPADLIQREVLAKNHRALVIYGDMHLQRRNVLTNYDDHDPNGHTLVSLLSSKGVKTFNVWTNTNIDLATVNPNILSWPNPSLTLLRGTELGAQDFTLYFPGEAPRISFREVRPTPVPRDQWRQLRMEDQFDAVLYLGPPSTITAARLSPALCSDATYMAMRLSRLTLGPPPPPGVPSPADGLKTYCATVAPK